MLLRAMRIASCHAIGMKTGADILGVIPKHLALSCGDHILMVELSEPIHACEFVDSLSWCGTNMERRFLPSAVIRDFHVPARRWITQPDRSHNRSSANHSPDH